SLKDNTASVLCQVPVDVASFLLNEKRAEISKIELKQRINVLMVPNKTMETPNYKLERLKHDDPRLDNIEASYKMADDMEDATGVTRRSQEPTNKQTPVIKGVLPDAPAPVPAPLPAASPAGLPVALPAALAAAVSAAAPKPVAKPAAPVGASKGLVGWLKNLFASDTPVMAAPATAKAKAEDKREEKRDSKSPRDAQHDGQRGPRPVRGGQRGERVQRQASTRDARPEGTRPENRGRGRNVRSSERSSSASGERTEPDGRALFAQGSNLDSVGAAEIANRQARPEPVPRGNLQNRPERSESAEGDKRFAMGQENQSEAAADNVEGLQNGSSHGPNPVYPAPVENPHVVAGFSVAPVNVDNAQTPQSAGNPEANNSFNGNGFNGNGNGNGHYGNRKSEPREKRSRDLYGRDRGQRGQRGERGPRRDARQGNPDPFTPPEAAFSQAPLVIQLGPSVPIDLGVSPMPATAPKVPTAAVTLASPVVPLAPRVQRGVATEQPAHSAALVPAATVVLATAPEAQPERTASMPKVGSYLLPQQELIAVAQSSGLQWVNSNAERIKDVQAAITAEPKPQRVPRERPPAVVPDNGPLVLVETKRDLRDM
ncbi:MAG: ribonuclease E/G, partial [Rhodoferax sp.]|nr:ribonuclease E/G [Rhodoferax sp.]